MIILCKNFAKGQEFYIKILKFSTFQPPSGGLNNLKKGSLISGFSVQMTSFSLIFVAINEKVE